MSLRIATYETSQQSTGRQKSLELRHRGEFLHNYYMFGSVHDGNHDIVVRIFIGLSCELGGFFNYVVLRGTIFYYQYAT